MKGVRYSYLSQQFADCDDLWSELKSFVATGDFTLGAPLQIFEKEFARLIGSDFAVGVNSGTDAIKLSLVAAGVGYGDEVITTANTFVATVGAIAEIGAKPVFVDCCDTFCMDTSQIESAITEKTKALVPVHFAGYMSDMREVNRIADKYDLVVVEDACQAILGNIDGKNSGTWGLTGAFSLHPLKNLNVWSDGGVIVTDSEDIYLKLKLLRNHGLIDRDTVGILGYNSRLDTIQAVVGNWLIGDAQSISDNRIRNASRLDDGLASINQITLPPRPSDMRIVYHLYMVHAENRDNLLDHCLSKGIEAKVHYPVPIYAQPALGTYGYGASGVFENADNQAKSLISFPCDQHLNDEQIDYIVAAVREFYL